MMDVVLFFPCIARSIVLDFGLWKVFMISVCGQISYSRFLSRFTWSFRIMFGVQSLRWLNVVSTVLISSLPLSNCIIFLMNWGTIRTMVQFVHVKTIKLLKLYPYPLPIKTTTNSLWSEAIKIALLADWADFSSRFLFLWNWLYLLFLSCQDVLASGGKVSPPRQLLLFTYIYLLACNVRKIMINSILLDHCKWHHPWTQIWHSTILLSIQLETRAFCC